MPSRSFDVIIVGGGGSGLAAAVSCAEQGLSVLLVEKQPELGGTTGIAIGSFTANQTAHQQRAGITDHLEDHVEDAGRFATAEIESRNVAALRRFFLKHSGETLNWLDDMGLAFHGPSPEPPNRVPRMHNVLPNATAYIAALHSRVLDLGGTIRCNAAVTNLLKTDGRISGIEAMIDGSTESIEAKRGVVLAAGDYANSPELIARFKGPEFSTIEGINQHACGDGHLLAERAGAKLINMDVTYGPELRFVPPIQRRGWTKMSSLGPFAKPLATVIKWLPRFIVDSFIKRLLVTWQHPENALFDDGAILINQHAERFCDETVWPDREIAVASQPGKTAFILLDERLIDRYREWPHFISTAPEIAYAYVLDYLKLRPDIAIEKESVHELAVYRNLPSQALITTIEQYNQEQQKRKDDAQQSREPLIGHRWVLLGPAKSYFTTTEGGAAINEQFAVLDANDNPIPGLFAVGQNGLGGQILWGHGLHIAWAITSGRLIGEHLASNP